MHTSVMLSDVDSKTLKRLGVDLTCEPVRESAAKGEFWFVNNQLIKNSREEKMERIEIVENGLFLVRSEEHTSELQSR